MTTLAQDDAITAVLDAIYDPCSVAAGRPISILGLGLVLGWELQANGRLRVRFCVTFPGCTMSPNFTEAARDNLETLFGRNNVDVVIDPSFLWTADRVKESGIS